MKSFKFLMIAAVICGCGRAALEKSSEEIPETVFQQTLQEQKKAEKLNSKPVKVLIKDESSPLVKKPKDSDVYKSKAGAEDLQNTDSPEAISSLKELFKDETPDLIILLVRSLDSEDPEIRSFAVEILSKLRDGRADEEISQCLESKNHILRKAIKEEMVKKLEKE